MYITIYFSIIKRQLWGQTAAFVALKFRERNYSILFRHSFLSHPADRIMIPQGLAHSTVKMMIVFVCGYRSHNNGPEVLCIRLRVYCAAAQKNCTAALHQKNCDNQLDWREMCTSFAVKHIP